MWGAAKGAVGRLLIMWVRQRPGRPLAAGVLLLLTSVTRKFMTSLFMSSFDTLTCASLDSQASLVMVFLLDVVGGMVLPASALKVNGCCGCRVEDWNEDWNGESQFP